MAALLQLVPTPAPTPLSILAPDLQTKLSAFNELTRDMRAAGVKVEALAVLDHTIFVSPESVDLIARRFAHEVRGSRYRTSGKYTRNAVTIRGVDVVWLTPVKEQNR